MSRIWCVKLVEFPFDMLFSSVIAMKWTYFNIMVFVILRGWILTCLITLKRSCQTESNIVDSDIISPTAYYASGDMASQTVKRRKPQSPFWPQHCDWRQTSKSKLRTLAWKTFFVALHLRCQQAQERMWVCAAPPHNHRHCQSLKFVFMSCASLPRNPVFLSQLKYCIKACYCDLLQQNKKKDIFCGNFSMLTVSQHGQIRG